MNLQKIKVIVLSIQLGGMGNDGQIEIEVLDSFKEKDYNKEVLENAIDIYCDDNDIDDEVRNELKKDYESYDGGSCNIYKVYIKDSVIEL